MFSAIRFFLLILLLAFGNKAFALVAQDSITATSENQPVIIPLEAIIAPGSFPSYQITQSPAHGFVVLGGNIWEGITATYTPTANYAGLDSFTFKVVDGLQESNVATVSIAVNSINDSPVITSVPVEASTDNVAYSYQIVATDADGDVLTYALNSAPAGVAINPSTGLIVWTSANAGTHTISVRVFDPNGGTTTQTYELVVTHINLSPSLTIASPDSGLVLTEGTSVTLSASATDVEDGNISASIQWSSSISGNLGAGANVLVTLPVGAHLITAQVADSSSASASASVSVTVNAQETPPNSDLPPDPAEVAPEITAEQRNNFLAMTDFLFSGSDPIQTDVDATTFDHDRIAVIRGKVLSRNGEVVSGVAITIKDHPEFGRTLSRADGEFDLAVNGGGSLLIDYSKTGYLPIQRQIDVPWTDYANADDVVMIQLDPNVSAIDLSASTAIQVAQGTVQSDSDGERQATVLFPAGTTATMTLPDGSVQNLTTLNVRATEYTVGENGQEAMPGNLPSSSAYTYAVELSVDEAIAAGATRVDFSSPVPVYVDNFLGFPVGAAVPSGYYDREKGAWIASQNGRIISILSINDGLAELDVDGSGTVADSAALAVLGITTDERIRLASLFSSGKSFWRVPITHFTPWDCNWPYAPPEDAEAPDSDQEPNDSDLEGGGGGGSDCYESGSIIECERQVLGESVDIVGTGQSLNYRSDRVLGRSAGRTLRIKLTDASVPASLQGVSLVVNVAGRTFTRSFSAAPNQVYDFVWNGLDAYGRPASGSFNVQVKVGYVYPVVYVEAEDEFERAFARFGSEVRFESSNTSVVRTVTLWAEWSKTLKSFDSASAVGLGGWSLMNHHYYLPSTQTLFKGDGTKESAGLANTISTAVGNPFRDVDGVARPGAVSSYMAIGPDGIYWQHDDWQNGFRGKIYKKSLHGDISVVVDPNAVSHSVAGGALDVDGDGNVIYATHEGRVYKFYPDGRDQLIAGGGDNATGDGILATEAYFGRWAILDLRISKDGSLYLLTDGGRTVKKVSADGRIHTIAGDPAVRIDSGDGGLAKDATFDAGTMDVASDGSIYLTSSNLRVITTDGKIKSVLDNEDELNFWASDVVALDDGSLVVSNMSGGCRIQYITPSKTLVTVAGNGDCYNEPKDGVNPLDSSLYSDWLLRLAVDQKGDIYVSDDWFGSIRRIENTYPDLLKAGETLIFAKNGQELYAFNPSGKHLRTLDTTTGEVIRTFGYEGNKLVSMTDQFSNVTQIVHHEGMGFDIVAPFGQTTEVRFDAQGYISAIKNPNNETYRAGYGTGGLLTSFESPNGLVATMSYDAKGNLLSDTNNNGNGWAFSRVDGERAFDVTKTSQLGRETTYRIDLSTAGDRQRTVTAPDGTVNISTEYASGDSSAQLKSGLEIMTVNKADVRFGMMSPIPANTVYTQPSGLSKTVAVSQTATLAEVGNPLSHTQLTTATTVNGSVFNAAFDRATLTQTNTSAEGRTSSRQLNTNGTLAQSVISGFTPVQYSYDAHGRLDTVAANDGAQTRTTEFAYFSSGHASGLLQSMTDAEGRTSAFVYDAAGRIISQTFPDSRQVSYSYDADGNLRTLTPPGSSTHVFNYNLLGQETEYEAPDVATVGNVATTYDFNADKDLELITLPSGQQIDYQYNEDTGKLETMLTPRGAYAYSYHPATAQIAGISAPGGVNLAYTYDGSLALSETLSGPVAGAVSVQYNTNFDVSQRCVNSSACTSFSYDDDFLLTQAGAMAIQREAQKGGAISGTTLGMVATTIGYNAFAELANYVASSGATTLFSASYVRDRLGRIDQINEQIQGAPFARSYDYDLAGRLVTTTVNGVTETYGYDANGNRTHLNGALIGSYDEQDRLVQYGDETFAHDDDGTVTGKTNTTTGDITTYHYDVFGNLVSASLPGGVNLQYILDGRNRRVGKIVGGALVQGFLYQDQLNPVAELNPDGSIRSRFVYATASNVPDYMIRSGVTYQIISDHLGSPRLVVNTTNGIVAQRMDYDVWGKVITDTNPGFQPFGYAGGIYDSHTKLTRFGARDYDASTGRWMSKDPIRFDGGLNLYGYVAADPVNFVDPSGFAPGDSYPTADAAGANAVNDINYKSITEGREYAGRVYQNPDGSYSYTAPNAGTKDSSYAGSVPPGTKNAGDYHTHGANDPDYDNENFSPQDKAVNDAEGVPGYLGTPSGIIKKYNPETERAKNLPYPKSKNPC